jgi:hypothetical protein
MARERKLGTLSATTEAMEKLLLVNGQGIDEGCRRGAGWLPRFRHEHIADGSRDGHNLYPRRDSAHGSVCPSGSGGGLKMHCR